MIAPSALLPISWDEPWFRKFNRALDHLDELKRELVSFQQRHPFAPVRDLQADADGRVFVYRAQLSEDWTDRFDVILGDVVHNLRSALDHITTQLVPAKQRRSVYFPIIMEPIFETDPESGEYLDRYEQPRKRWMDTTANMPEKAVELIRGCQPWRVTEIYGDRLRLHPFLILSGTDNADKHYELATIALGIKNPITAFEFRGCEIHAHGFGGHARMFRAGEIVGTFAMRPAEIREMVAGIHPLDLATLLEAPQNESEVTVDLRGTPEAAFKVRGEDSYVPMIVTLEHLFDMVRFTLIGLNFVVGDIRRGRSG